MKKNIAVLFGGASSEHDISCISAEFILSNIPKDKYVVYPIAISKEGDWFLLKGDYNSLANNAWKNIQKLPVLVSPSVSNSDIFAIDGDKIIPLKIDLVFPVLHGKNGEDGSVQGIFQLNAIPIVGCKLAASALCMDKVSSNIMFDHAKINQAKYSWIWNYEVEENISNVLDKIEHELEEYPIFVKPSAAGSSIGVSKVSCRSELEKALKLAALEDSKILAERAIVGRELECAVLGNQNNLKISTVGEIATNSDFYDYNSKYKDNSSKLYIPANISDNISEKIKNIAGKAYKLMGCSGLARVDFFLSDNEVYLNEINTLPGFTAISMYPKLFEHAGVSAAQLISTLIDLAFSERQ